MRRLRWLSGGESHGPGLTVILEGLPAGLILDRDAINTQLARRQHGFGRGGRQKIEKDRVMVRGGLRGGMTLGSPLVLEIENRDFGNWAAVMDPWEENTGANLEKRVTRPRPGHADYAGAMATARVEDLRNILERASARETAARVLAGAVAAQLLGRYGIEMRAAVLAIGERSILDGPPDWDDLQGVDPASPLVTPFPGAEEDLVEYVRKAGAMQETLGGVIGVVVRNLPPGLGSHVHWDRKLDGRLAQALLSIPSVKAFSIGAGLEVSRKVGSEAHDAIFSSERGLKRTTNRAGGLEGGVTNGEDLVLRAFFKPIATLRRGLPSVDLLNGEVGTSRWERSDVTAIASAPVIVEAMTALILADALLESFGGASIEALDAAFRSHLDRVAKWWSPR